MKKVTKISEVISYLKIVQKEFGDLTITTNTEFNCGTSEEDIIIYGDDDIYLNIIERDISEGTQEKVLSIQNVEHIDEC